MEVRIRIQISHKTGIWKKKKEISILLNWVILASISYFDERLSFTSAKTIITTIKAMRKKFSLYFYFLLINLPKAFPSVNTFSWQCVVFFMRLKSLFTLFFNTTTTTTNGLLCICLQTITFALNGIALRGD